MSCSLAGLLPDEVAMQMLGVFRLLPPIFYSAVVQSLEGHFTAGYVPSLKIYDCA